jgi:hypothetical protein
MDAKKKLKFSRFLKRKLRDHMIGLAGLYLWASTPTVGSFHAGLSIKLYLHKLLCLLKIGS